MRSVRDLIAFIAAQLALIAIAHAALEGTYARLMWASRGDLKRLHVDPDATHRPYRDFIDRVAATTPPGTTIRLLLPHDPRNNPIHGEPPVRRAKYLLAGRTVTTAPTEPADYVAVWNVKNTTPGYDLVWSIAGGELRRRRN